jgi:hypothetical protein
MGMIEGIGYNNDETIQHTAESTFTNLAAHKTHLGKTTNFSTMRRQSLPDHLVTPLQMEKNNAKKLIFNSPFDKKHNSIQQSKNVLNSTMNSTLPYQ